LVFSGNRSGFLSGNNRFSDPCSLGICKVYKQHTHVPTENGGHRALSFTAPQP
jgi:hypothetical protein